MITWNRRKKVLAVGVGFTVAALALLGRRTMRAEPLSDGNGLTSVSLGRMRFAADRISLASAAMPAPESVLQASGHFEGAGGGALKADAFKKAPAMGAFTARAADRKVVRNATLSFEVLRYAAARQRLLDAARRFGAEVRSDTTSSGDDNASGIVVLDVPPDRLDAFIKELDGLGRIQERTVSEENLGEEYVDLASRLANLRRVEKRLNDLLSFKTYRLGDVLQVERELERVGAEIEQIEGRQKYIDRQVASSIVTINLSEPVKEAGQEHGVTIGIRNSLVRAANTFIATGMALLNLTGFMLAVGAWLLPVMIPLWIFRKRVGAWLNVG